ncbi:MAG: hypothetical protein WC718_05280 [Phycisphaerales bacterium]|jgi:hypothetical protein
MRAKNLLAGLAAVATACGFAQAQAVFPDVILADITNTQNYGAVGGIRGYAIGSNTCNIGTANLAWVNSGSPGLAMNAFRIHDGRMIQLGLGFAKTACCAAAGSGCQSFGGGPCNGAGGSQLGAGCLDIYSAGFNGGQSRLAPRSTMNGFTGAFSSFPGTSGDAIFRRVQIPQSDLTAANFPGARYFIEGVYVAQDDAPAGAGLNNATSKQVNVDGSFNLTPTGAAFVGKPAIRLWREQGLGVNQPDTSVIVGTVTVPTEGTFHTAYKVRQLTPTSWRYDYAVYNLNSDRSGGSFSVPVPPGTNVTDMGFHAPLYHSGEPYSNTPWTMTSTSGSVTWSSPQTFAQNPNSNALRWGTMYNFWFTADSGPAAATSNATLGLFKPGAVTSLTIPVQVPTGPACNPDLNADGNIDQGDIDYIDNVVAGGANPTNIDADFNKDGNADQADVDAVIGVVAGEACPS